jgi:hypothetical protein
MKYLYLFSRVLTYNGFGQCNRMSDYLALVELYDSTGGVSWTNTWNVTQQTNTCVTLNSNSYANQLSIINNKSIGSLIDLNLPQLSNLTYNQLSGEFSTITSLSHLEIQYNLFTSESLTTTLIVNDNLINNATDSRNDYFAYTPQNAIGTLHTIVLSTDDNDTSNLGFNDTITTSKHYWYRKDILFNSTAPHEYLFTNVQLSTITLNVDN